MSDRISIKVNTSGFGTTGTHIISSLVRSVQGCPTKLTDQGNGKCPDPPILLRDVAML